MNQDTLHLLGPEAQANVQADFQAMFDGAIELDGGEYLAADGNMAQSTYETEAEEVAPPTFAWGMCGPKASERRRIELSVWIVRRTQPKVGRTAHEFG